MEDSVVNGVLVLFTWLEFLYVFYNSCCFLASYPTYNLLPRIQRYYNTVRGKRLKKVSGKVMPVCLVQYIYTDLDSRSTFNLLYKAANIFNAIKN